MKFKARSRQKTVISVLLVFSMIFSILFVAPSKDVYASSITKAMIDSVCNKYGFSSGKYWTYDYTNVSSVDDYDILAQQGYTSSDKPYGDEYKSKFEGNVHAGEYYYHGSRQCMAFCELLGYEITGSYPKSDWTHYNSKAAVEATGGLQVGDVIRTSNGHSAMVLSVSGSTVKTVECWGSTNSRNKISYNGYYNGKEKNKTFDDICNNLKLEYVARYNGMISPNNDSTIVNTADELLEALNIARTSETQMNIALGSDISITVSEYADKYPEIIYGENYSYSINKVVTNYNAAGYEYYKLGKDKKEKNNISMLHITNCVISGNHYLSITGNLYVDKDAYIDNGERINCITHFKSNIKNNAYLCVSNCLINNGEIRSCYAKTVFNNRYGRIDYLGLGNSNAVPEVENAGWINWCYCATGDNRGEIVNLVTDSNSGSFVNFGTVVTLCSSINVYSKNGGIGLKNFGARYLQIGGTLVNSENSRKDDTIIWGGTVENGSYSNSLYMGECEFVNSKVYFSITVSGLRCNDSSGDWVYDFIQETMITVFLANAHKTYEWFSPDGTGNTTYLFTASSIKLNTLLESADGIGNIFSSYSFNVYEDCIIDDEARGMCLVHMNGKKIDFTSLNSKFSIPEHIEFDNGTISLYKPLAVTSPNTLVLNNVDIELGEDVTDEAFLCDNGHIIFNNCDSVSGQPIEVKLNSQTDLVEIYDDDERMVEYVEGDSVATEGSDFIVRYGDTTNGVTSVQSFITDTNYELMIYSSLLNALSSTNGSFNLISDAVINDLVIPEDTVLNVDEGLNISVAQSFVNEGSVTGNGNIDVAKENGVVNNGVIEDSINLVTPTPTTAPTPTTDPTLSPTPTSPTPTNNPGVNPTPTVNPTSTNSPTVVPTNDPTPIVAEPTPTDNPTPTPTKEASELSVGDFINRCYEVAFGREADEAGYNYWVDNLNNGQACGAQVGFGFIFSQEYINRNRTNEEFVKDMYAMYFGREADEAGFNYWVEQLNNNTATREDIMAGFANSEEFFNLCGKYGVTCGTYLVGIPNDQQGGVNSFVARLYKVCLNRLPDQGGQAGWVQKLMNGEVTGSTCAYGFVFSQEFINLNLDNTDFVKYMYNAFFGREADEAGLTYWVEQLNNGTAGREDVFNGFTGSPEFANLCASYGINA